MSHALALILGFLVVADKEADAVKKDLAQLEGEWSMTAAERDGEKIPEGLLAGSKRVTKGDETSIHIGNQLFMKATFKIDPSKTPKEIDYDVKEGMNKGMKQLGIYEIKGDAVKFCFSAPGEKRPSDFTTKEGSKLTMSAWKKK